MKNIKTLLKIDFLQKSLDLHFTVFLNDFKGESVDSLLEVDEHIANTLSLGKIRDEYGPINNWTVLSSIINENEFDNGHFILTDDPAIELAKEAARKAKLELALLKKEIAEEFIANIDDYKVTKDDIVQDLEEGTFTVHHPAFDKVEFSIFDIYGLIEKDCFSDTEITNSFSKKVLTLNHGDFLNAGIADIRVFENAEDKKNDSLFNPKAKGGIFVRDNGILHVGDINRTKFLTLDMTELIKELYVQGSINKANKFLENIKLINK